ncbi:IS66 family transposase [Ktedonosporobacter rubrisoli]|uniref:IS66 family transposase n=1 Tax=Ktedonosporobacter rubrisoli TaxID=2509675 RepID=UPI0013EE8772
MSAGSLLGWVRTCSQALTEVETRIKEGLRKAGVIHQDETDVCVRKHHSYVHVCSTSRLTHFGSHPSRGRSALNDIGILAGFDGTSIHDGYKISPSYRCKNRELSEHHARNNTVFLS